MCTMTISLPPLPLPTTTCTIHYLERRSSYLAKVPYQQNRPVKQKISDAAMRLSPATWLTPAILRAHDAHEYKKDRRRLDQQYQSHRHEQLMREKRSIGEREGSFSADTFRTGTMTTSTTLTPGRASAIGPRSELTLPRAKVLEWAGNTSVFSPGVLQEWMMVGGGGGDDEEIYSAALGPDPWAWPPIEDYGE